jgi:hypothetical protein
MTDCEDSMTTMMTMMVASPLWSIIDNDSRLPPSV